MRSSECWCESASTSAAPDNPPQRVTRLHPFEPDDTSMSNRRFAGRVIVIVDDDQHMRTLLEVTLRLDGAKVIATGDPTRAEQMIAFVQPDLVLLDVDMPVVDGWELARRLRANRFTAGIPFLFVSGSAGIEPDAAAIAGAAGLVPKPFDPELLETSIDAVLTSQLSGLTSGTRPAAP
jgi:CheY-like chemotaxis protein